MPQRERREEAIALQRLLAPAAAARAFAPAAGSSLPLQGDVALIFGGGALLEEDPPAAERSSAAAGAPCYRAGCRKAGGDTATESSGSGDGSGRRNLWHLPPRKLAATLQQQNANCLSDCSSCGADSRRAVGVASARDYAAEENYRCEDGGCCCSCRCEVAVALAPPPIRAICRFLLQQQKCCWSSGRTPICELSQELFIAAKSGRT